MTDLNRQELIRRIKGYRQDGWKVAQDLDLRSSTEALAQCVGYIEIANAVEAPIDYDYANTIATNDHQGDVTKVATHKVEDWEDYELYQKVTESVTTALCCSIDQDELHSEYHSVNNLLPVEETMNNQFLEQQIEDHNAEVKPIELTPQEILYFYIELKKELKLLRDITGISSTEAETFRYHLTNYLLYQTEVPDEIETRIEEVMSKVPIEYLTEKINPQTKDTDFLLGQLSEGAGQYSIDNIASKEFVNSPMNFRNRFVPILVVVFIVEFILHNLVG